MKLHQIRCVIAAARGGSFRRAAAELNVRQSSVSRGVRELEDRLGAALFQRSAGGVLLTAVGAQFLKDAEAALDQLALATHLAGSVGRDERQVLRIGAVPVPGSGFLPEALHTLATSSPGCRLVLHEASSTENLAGVRFGALDLAVVFASGRLAPGVEAVPLWREPLFCAQAARADDGRGVVSWADIGPHDLILPAGELGDMIVCRLTQVFGEAFVGASCRAGAETGLRLAAAGQGRAIVSGAATALRAPGVSLSPVIDDGVLVSAVRLQRNEKPALRRLMGVLRQMAASGRGSCLSASASGRLSATPVEAG
ncbi:MAG TPA: LysR family transcriptional regulator [Caulobacteraceae bacterium]